MARSEFAPVFDGWTPEPGVSGTAPCYDDTVGQVPFTPYSVHEFEQSGEEMEHPTRPSDCILPTMSKEQLEAYHELLHLINTKPKPLTDLEDPQRLHGRVTILTGAAGTGKSTIINWLRLTASITVCATTASAALLCNGKTIDRIFAMKRNDWSFNPARLEKNMTHASGTIVVDEASMIGHNMATILVQVLESFPRKRLILVGDWAQAKPVKDPWPFGSPLFLGATVIKLSEVHRQSDGEYLNALNRVREGELPEWFDQCIGEVREEDVCLYATNAMTKERNIIKLMELNRAEWAPDTPVTPGMEYRKGGIWKPAPEELVQELSKLALTARIAYGFRMRAGARVVITWNDRDGQWVNGDSGEITEDPKPIKNGVHYPVVIRLDRTGEEIDLPPIVASLYHVDGGVPDMDGNNIRITGYPFFLGWALTIHRSQGMTIPSVFVSMSSLRSFTGSKHGLAYVALSRTKNAEDLRIDERFVGGVETSQLVLPLL